MRALIVAAIAMLAACASSTPPPAAFESERPALQRVLDDWLSAWNAHDMARWSKLFVEDADFIPITGQHLVGRPAILAYHDELHRTLFKDRQQTASWADIRLIRPDIALGHVSFHAFTPGDPSRNVEALATVALVKHDGGWQIYALHNASLAGSVYGEAPR